MKKIFALFVAMCLTFSISAVAFADGMYSTVNLLSGVSTTAEAVYSSTPGNVTFIGFNYSTGNILVTPGLECECSTSKTDDAPTIKFYNSSNTLLYSLDASEVSSFVVADDVAYLIVDYGDEIDYTFTLVGIYYTDDVSVSLATAVGMVFSFIAAMLTFITGNWLLLFFIAVCLLPVCIRLFSYLKHT